MAKRFIDTGLFDDEWFADLKTDSKIFWIYFLTKCDHAGLLKFNKRLIEFQTGIKSLDTVIKEIGNRLVKVNDQLFFCPKFIQFQYPNFPKSGVKQQDSAIELLIKNGLWDSETNTFNSLVTVTEDLPKSYDSDNGNDNDNVLNKKESKEKIQNPFEGQLSKSWDEWVKHRKEVRRKLTPSTADKQIEFLKARAPNEAVQIIQTAIEKGWHGLYELNKQPNGHRNPTSRTSSTIGSVIDPGKNYDE